jgi:hypothetical protein
MHFHPCPHEPHPARKTVPRTHAGLGVDLQDAIGPLKRGEHRLGICLRQVRGGMLRNADLLEQRRKTQTLQAIRQVTQCRVGTDGGQYLLMLLRPCSVHTAAAVFESTMSAGAQCRRRRRCPTRPSSTLATFQRKKAPDRHQKMQVRGLSGAPPSGLEPETLRLTVECSAN